MKTNTEIKLRLPLLKQGLLLAATALCCATVRAEDLNANPNSKTSASGIQADASVQTSDAKGLEAKCQQFIQDAAKCGMKEVKIGQMAIDHGQSSEVKRFGERLVKDHSKANAELTRIAASKGVDVNQETLDQLDHHRDKDMLSDKSGAEFDKAFAKHMIIDHKKGISKFERASRETKDAELKGFVDKTLPTLREHLQMAQSLARTVGLTEADINVSAADQGDNVGNAAVSVDTGTDRDLKRDNTVDSPNGADVSIKNNGADASVNLNTDKSDGKILGVQTQRGDGKTLGITTDKNDGKTLGVETQRGDGKTLGLNTDKSDGKTLGVDAQRGDGKTLGVTTKKGDHKVLGLKTDKNDGKYLGVIPAPHKKASADAEVKADVSKGRVDVDVDTKTSTDTTPNSSK